MAPLGHLWSQDDHQGSSFGSIRGISIESTARNPQKQHSSPTKNFSSRFKFSSELFFAVSRFLKNKNQKRDFKNIKMHTSVLYSRKIAVLDVPGVVSGVVPVSSWYPDKKKDRNILEFGERHNARSIKKYKNSKLGFQIESRFYVSDWST